MENHGSETRTSSFIQSTKSALAATEIKSFVDETLMFCKASLNTKREVVIWTCGRPLRALLVVLAGIVTLLVVSAGIVTLLALSGMLEFMVVFVAATVNAIVISFLISLAAVGGFYVDFFACMEIMYLGFLFITAFVTFTIPMSSIIVALVAAGPTKVYLVDALGIALHHDVAGGLSQHVTKDYANRLSILY
ncbi:hypothetical protein E3N88_21711 [Mikania micrantha]|uniref:Uncharacterized protein n=1 Tax=Mikania micrantha TaxID=192012 RepID=A0A5N6NA70_9ASTR|nr:hypothetical protein E3N88_21711 [Mikania micrantha]